MPYVICMQWDIYILDKPTAWIVWEQTIFFCHRGGDIDFQLFFLVVKVFFVCIGHVDRKSSNELRFDARWADLEWHSVFLCIKLLQYVVTKNEATACHFQQHQGVHGCFGRHQWIRLQDRFLPWRVCRGCQGYNSPPSAPSGHGLCGHHWQATQFCSSAAEQDQFFRRSNESLVPLLMLDRPGEQPGGDNWKLQ